MCKKLLCQIQSLRKIHAIAWNGFPLAFLKRCGFIAEDWLLGAHVTASFRLFSCTVSEKNWNTKEDKGINMMLAMWLLQFCSEKARLGRSDVEQWRNQACSPFHCWVMLGWRHKLARYSTAQVHVALSYMWQNNSLKCGRGTCFNRESPPYNWRCKDLWLKWVPRPLFSKLFCRV